MTLPPVNPGLALLLAAALVPVAPRALRGPLQLLAVLVVLALPFGSDFRVSEGIAKLGLQLTPVRLDALSQLFGLAGGLAALAVLIAGLDRPDKLRDSATLALFGGGLGAIYAGDLISFTALLECASLATAALVFAGGGAEARRASIAVLTWQSWGGGFLVIGAGLVWGQTGSSLMRYLAVGSIGPLLICLGLALKIGVAPAQAWLRDAADHAPPLGLSAILGVGLLAPMYGLARCFPGEPILLALGAILTLYPLVLAATTRSAAQACALGMAALLGPALLVIGTRGELSVAAGGLYVFAICLAGSLAPLCLQPPARGLRGAPALLVGLTAAWAASFLPGGLGFSVVALVMDELARDGGLWAWMLVALAAACAPLHLGGRWLTLAWGEQNRLEEDARGQDFPFSLGRSLLAFLLVLNAINPRWLFALAPPKGVLYQPYGGGHLWSIGQLSLAGVVALALLQALNLYPRSRLGHSSDPADWMPRFAGALVGASTRVLKLPANLLQLMPAWTKFFSRAAQDAETPLFGDERRITHSPLMLLCFVAMLALLSWVFGSR